MKTTGFTCLCFWLLALSSQAQTPVWEEVSKEDMAKVFGQISNWYKNTTNYTLTITHASFENYSTAAPFEKSVGYFRKEAENYHSFLLGIHTIQNAKYKIVLDTANKAMIVANVDKSIWDAYTLDDYKYTLNSCTGIKKTTLNQDKKYRLEYGAGYPLERFELLLTNDGFLKEIVLYYSKKVPKNPDDEKSEKVKPRLSITFSNFKKLLPGTGDGEFDEKQYFIINRTKLLPAPKYAGFTLSDQRLNLD